LLKKKNFFVVTELLKKKNFFVVTELLEKIHFDLIEFEGELDKWIVLSAVTMQTTLTTIADQ
jgi:hypothetical protein